MVCAYAAKIQSFKPDEAFACLVSDQYPLTLSPPKFFWACHPKHTHTLSLSLPRRPSSSDYLIRRNYPLVPSSKPRSPTVLHFLVDVPRQLSRGYCVLAAGLVHTEQWR